ncbi:three-helix bundle dimerization domain-containing protein [Nocardia sp. NPDC004068]|uniref:three-helix bundle dimerization domain-containing protein n=1 Tax=Nocardia sp. NPDC004068 TaxID=3364303 RepID=UPI0036965424
MGETVTREDKQAREQKALREMTDRLVADYADTHSARQVEDVIAAAVGRFEGHSVRDFVPILVERIVRRQLSGTPEPTEFVAAEPVSDEPTGAGRWRALVSPPWTVRKLALPLGALVVVAIVAIVVGTSGTSTSPAPAAAAPTVIRGVVGSEKSAFFADPKVVYAFARNGIRVEAEPAGSRQIATSVDLGKYDFAFPSSAPAAERILRQRNVTAKYTPFSSPMAIATFAPIADLLTRAGVVRPGPTPTFDMGRYLDLIAGGKQWDQLPDNTVYPVRKNILVSTTDPRTSNSAAMYLAIASYVANDNTVVRGATAEEFVLGKISKLFVGQGYSDNSSEGPFAQYLSAGMGPTPLVLCYEAQYVEAAAAGRVTPDMVLMYPSPTVLSRHTLVPLTPEGDRVGRLLTTDPELQDLAAAHGFRTDDPARFSKVTDANRVPVRKDVIDVVDTPAYDTLEHLLDGVAKSYN